MQPNPPSKTSLIVFNGVLILIAVAFLIWVLSPDQEADPPKPKEPTELEAFLVAQRFVEQQLKSPSTAEFPASVQSQIMKTDSATWQITSYVDSQNGFGAMLRTPFVVQVRYIGNDNWNLVSLDFIE